MIKLSRALLCGVACMIIAAYSFAQQLTADVQDQIDQYQQALEIAITENKHDDAAGICGKIAYLYWNNRKNQEAISYFNQSIEHNQKAGNKNGIKSAYYNLGLVQIDNEEYPNALTSFKKGIKLSKELKQKNYVLSGLINAASVSQSIGQNQEAIDLALEALNIAQELENINLTKRCYGILYECYQAIGNSEKSLEYFDLYSTVDRFLRDEQAKKIQTESSQKVAAIANEKAKSDKALEISNLKLQIAQDSLYRAREIAERQRLQLKLNEITLREQEAQLENERLIRNGLIIITCLTLLFLAILYIQYRQKREKNILLSEQNDQITRQKGYIQKQGENLSIKNEELIAVNKEKNLMMSMVAHDLKKPINDLTSLSVILEQYKDKLPEDFNHLVSVLKKSSEGYRDMVHKILDAGAIESRKLNVVEEKLDVRDVLEGNVQSQSLTAGKKKISFDLSEIPDNTFVKADKIYLTQAIENVLYNAVKYSPENSTIYLGANGENGHLDLFVRDEGPGITTQDQKYLFETFKPLKNGDIESTGLGLSISKKYIEAMSGSIWCESEEGNGTTFFFQLPKWDT
ncbi:tetratricopeptide repeat-containing sensor histidine kinase [Ekhidna sp.]|uniref:tetratricopeptide repeat-containing sensor histidine kinase n=1 Tax=Ekhidna sp. TaxID=2608089 RepID=UPI003B50174F